jgi:hypothetical protein
MAIIAVPAVVATGYPISACRVTASIPEVFSFNHMVVIPGMPRVGSGNRINMVSIAKTGSVETKVCRTLNIIRDGVIKATASDFRSPASMFKSPNRNHIPNNSGSRNFCFYPSVTRFNTTFTTIWIRIERSSRLGRWLARRDRGVGCCRSTGTRTAPNPDAVDYISARTNSFRRINVILKIVINTPFRIAVGITAVFVN